MMEIKTGGERAVLAQQVVCEVKLNEIVEFFDTCRKKWNIMQPSLLPSFMPSTLAWVLVIMRKNTEKLKLNLSMHRYK
jgi:hypothetical protein